MSRLTAIQTLNHSAVKLLESTLLLITIVYRLLSLGLRLSVQIASMKNIKLELLCAREYQAFDVNYL